MKLKYSDEQINFIRINKKNTEKNIIEMFYNKFNILLTKSKLENLKHRYGLQSGLKGGQFKKGLIPFNKGKKQSEYMSFKSIEKIKQTCFKKANHSFNNADHNKRQIMEERETKDGYIKIKIAEPNKWELKHRWIWKNANGKIPKGYIVSFADGNKINFDLDNLILVKRSENLIMNKQGLYFNNAEITKTGLNIAKIINKNNELKKV